MYSKKLTSIIVIAILMLFITSCEHGNEVVDFEIVTFPNRIIYAKDVDKKLDLEGMVIESKSRSGISSELVYSNSLDNHITSDIDFSNTGVYEVKIIINSCEQRFPVQVVDEYIIRD